MRERYCLHESSLLASCGSLTKCSFLTSSRPVLHEADTTCVFSKAGIYKLPLSRSRRSAPVPSISLKSLRNESSILSGARKAWLRRPSAASSSTQGAAPNPPAVFSRPRSTSTPVRQSYHVCRIYLDNKRSPKRMWNKSFKCVFV